VHLVCNPLPDPEHRAHGLTATVVVIGVGNPFRHDDAAGLDVARLLRGRLPDGVGLLERDGEPTGLLAAWDGADAAWIIDAVSSGAPAGTVHRIDAGRQPLPAELFRASTHALGLADAVELARVLGRLPAHTIIYGISGADFSAGQGLSPPVAAAAATVAAAILAEVARYRGVSNRSPHSGP
jgi:hydrogenase maturation protease